MLEIVVAVRMSEKTNEQLDEIIHKTLTGKHDDIEGEEIRIRMDFSRLDDSEEDRRSLVEFFDSSPTDCSFPRLLGKCEEFLMGLLILIKLDPDRYGEPPASADDISRLPPSWALWYMFLSSLSKNMKSIR